MDGRQILNDNINTMFKTWIEKHFWIETSTPDFSTATRNLRITLIHSYKHYNWLTARHSIFKWKAGECLKFENYLCSKLGIFMGY